MNRTGSTTPDGSESSFSSNPQKTSIILSSRASISRNLSNHKFPSSCSTGEKNQIISIIKNSAGRIKGLSELCFFKISKVAKIQRQVILSDYQLEEDFISDLTGRGVLIKPRHSIRDTATAVPICWNDHLKIQATSVGNEIDTVHNKVSEVEKMFESRLNFSFSKEWGYLTSNPADLGTALEISLLVHLPALAISPEITEFMKNLSKIGCAIGGYAGENSEVTGNIFRVSSSKTLGKSEKEIVEEMNAICLNIVDDEEGARKKLVEKDRLGAKDNIFRSYGLLKYAKILSFEESLELLSILRLGLDLEIIEKIKDFDYFKIINMISDAHIISGYEMGDQATGDDVDCKRAELIRERILED